jgi:hypothetical protein
MISEKPIMTSKVIPTIPGSRKRTQFTFFETPGTTMRLNPNPRKARKKSDVASELLLNGFQNMLFLSDARRSIIVIMGCGV